MFKSRIIFILLAAISFVIAATFTGMIGYLIRTPANFIAALLSCSLLIFATVRWSKYNRWPVAVFALALLIVTMWAETPVKQILQVSLSDSALDISPTDQHKFKGTAFFKFSENSYLDFEHAGHELVQLYGDHHYYAVPVMANIANEQEARFWAWCRTKNPKNENQLKRIFDEEIDYGLRVKDVTIRRNTEKAILAAAREHGLTVHDQPIILEWGRGKDNGPFIERLMIMFFSFMVIVTGAIIMETVIHSRKKKKKAAAKAGKSSS